MSHSGDKSEGLTSKQVLLIELLMEGSKIGEAATMAGVTRRTASRWMQDPVFSEALHLAQAGALQEASRRLTALSSKAIDTLVEIIDGGWNKGDNIRRQAAGDLLTMAFKFVYMADLERRIYELEQGR